MNKKKGFTLIELLAVIVILAIIALIITPIITDIIKRAKEAADLRSAEAYVKAGDIFYSEAVLDSNKKTLLGTNVIDSIDVSGNKGTGSLIVNSDGTVAMAIVINNKCYTKTSNDYIDNIKVSSDIDNCKIAITTGPIYDVVMSNFPYLEVGDNGCKNATDNNYSYMGGCYIKYDNNLKKLFANNLHRHYKITDATINSLFDSNGNLSETACETTLYPIIAAGHNLTVEELKTEAGDKTILEYDTGYTYEDINAYYEELSNYIWYSGFVWRIMGINSDKSVRMITEENETAISYDDDSSLFNGSYAEDWLNNYFYIHLKNTSIITNGSFCERGTNYVTDSTTANSAMCVGTTINDKIGLISLDEYNLASGNSSYLVNSQFVWTLTPYSSSFAWLVNSYGDAHDNGVIGTSGLRPVINVKSASSITKGNGTLSDSYILGETKGTNITGNLKDIATSGEYVTLAGKTYRVVSIDSSGNTKLILDGYYEETAGTNYEMKYGSTNTFDTTTTTGVGYKLNNDVLNYLIPSSDTTNRNKLVTYNWYQNNFDWGNSYTVSLNETSPTRTISAKVGLIRVGEMLSDQSLTILNNNNTVTGNATPYWTMTPYIDKSYIWFVYNNGGTSKENVNNARGLRPVIVVNSSVTITSGNGTPSSPYQI